MRSQLLVVPVVLSLSAVAAAIVVARTGHDALALMLVAPTCVLALMTYLAIEFNIIRPRHETS